MNSKDEELRLIPRSLRDYKTVEEMTPAELHQRWLNRVTNYKPKARKCMISSIERGKVKGPSIRSSSRIGQVSESGI